MNGLRARARVLAAVRQWFSDNGYLEVHTPTLVKSPAMEEHLHPVAADGGFLRTSPEFALKRVVASGLHRIYEIGPCFRDHESGPWHGREFTMIEWYRAGAAVYELMDDVEQLVAAAGGTQTAWRRVSVSALFREVCDIDLTTATAHTLSNGRDASWDDAFFRRWVTDIEPTLTQPTFVYDWPASQCALATVRTDGPWPVAERFEAYYAGIELANAFQELTDSEEQRKRFAAANAARSSAGASPNPMDSKFVDAVGRMPRTAGIAMGLDRLVAAAQNWPSIAPGRL